MWDRVLDHMLGKLIRVDAHKSRNNIYRRQDGKTKRGSSDSKVTEITMSLRFQTRVIMLPASRVIKASLQLSLSPAAAGSA